MTSPLLSSSQNSTETKTKDIEMKGVEWECKKCTYLNPSTRTQCEMCAIPKAAPLEADWACPACTFLNDPQMNKCIQCFTRKSSSSGATTLLPTLPPSTARAATTLTSSSTSSSPSPSSARSPTPPPSTPPEWRKFLVDTKSTGFADHLSSYEKALRSIERRLRNLSEYVPSVGTSFDTAGVVCAYASKNVGDEKQAAEFWADWDKLMCKVQQVSGVMEALGRDIEKLLSSRVFGAIEKVFLTINMLSLSVKAKSLEVPTLLFHIKDQANILEQQFEVDEFVRSIVTEARVDECSQKLDVVDSNVKSLVDARLQSDDLVQLLNDAISVGDVLSAKKYLLQIKNRKVAGEVWVNEQMKIVNAMRK